MASPDDPLDPLLTIDPQGPQPSGAVREEIATKLVVLKGPNQGLEVPLDLLVEIGCGDRCQLMLDDPAVSRRHVSVSKVGGRLLIKDLGSRNGTFVDGTRLVEGEVQLGAVLTIGDSAIALQPRFLEREIAPSAARQFFDLVGESVVMRELFALLERVAPTDLSALIVGESGVGKELVSRAIHSGSSRSAGPYEVFDCSAIPAELADSELFGHVRGSFTGASDDRAGAFERAVGGTLCLDEIGELPLDLQPKLLRAIEQREIRRVGGNAVISVDVRVIAATNRDLEAEVRRGNFRHDLLFRLDVVRLRVPPLRRRLDDIPLLVSALLEGRVAPEAIAGENLERLVSYRWPGNVRELRNALERAMALTGEKQPDFASLSFDLGPSAGAPATLGMSYPGVAAPMPYKDAKALLLADFERAYVEALTSRHKGNVARAAAAAKISRKHLYELMRKKDDES